MRKPLTIAFNTKEWSKKSLTEIITLLVNDNPDNEWQASRTFNSAATAKRYQLQRQPACAFESQAHIRGIAGRYAFPPDAMPYQLENALMGLSFEPALLPLLTDLWRRLLSLNPELKQVSIRQESVMDFYHAVFGVTSGFNIDDINFYIVHDRHDLHPRRYSQELPYLKPLYADITRQGYILNWAAAPATVEKIKAKLDQRDARRRKKLSSQRPPPGPWTLKIVSDGNI